MSDFYVADICTSDLYHLFKFSNLWPILTYSNRPTMTSLTYARTLTQTNKLIIDLRIWKGPQFWNQTVIWDNDFSGRWFESIKYITFPGLGSCQDEHGWLSSSWCSFPSVQLQNKTKLNAFLFLKNWMQSFVVLLACESIDQSTFAWSVVASDWLNWCWLVPTQTSL